MLKQTIIKEAESAPWVWRSPTPRKHEPEKKLTDQELYDMLCEVPFNKGQFIWMGPKDTQQADINRMGYIAHIEWDADKLYYDFKGRPKPFVFMSLMMCSDRNRHSVFTSHARPHCRWEDCENYSIVTDEIRAKVEDDYVQNYIKEHADKAIGYIS